MLPANFIVENADLTQQTAQYNKLLQDRRLRLRDVKPDHPDIIAFDQQIASLRVVILSTIRSARGTSTAR